MMKRFAPILLVLAACSPDRANSPDKMFEPFSWGSDSYYCTFYAADYETEGVSRDDLDLMFVTLFDDINNEARVRYGGETLRLMPQEDLGTLPVPRNTVYTVLEYSKFEVQVTLESVGENIESEDFIGQIKMLGADASMDIKGSCGV